MIVRAKCPASACLLLWLALGLAVQAVPLMAAVSRPRPAQLLHVSGREYVRVSDWARSHDMTARWLKRDDILEASGNPGRVQLTVNSSLGLLNGLQVWLSFPVVSRNGAVYVSLLDVRKTLEPLLWPPRSRNSDKVALVCLDPGHGGKDPGFRSGRQYEKTYTLLLAREVQSLLQAAGVKAFLTRTTDRFIDLPLRPESAHQRGADLFVSLHYNSVEVNRSLIRGAEVYCLSPAGTASTNSRGQSSYYERGAYLGNRNDDKNVSLAYHVLKSLVKDAKLGDRGVRRARFAVLRDAPMPAILVEAGFMSHPVEGQSVTEAASRHRVAQAIADGILAFLSGRN